MNELPFEEIKIGENKFKRTFSPITESEEYKWHLDGEDRIVKPLNNNDWFIQIDNQLPKPLNETVRINRGQWHRVIKGTTLLEIELTKLV